MATMDEPPSDVTDGDDQTWGDITWTDIAPNGDESQEFGRIWAQAPPLAGMCAWWVLPDQGGAAVLVARASRRHRSGRDMDGRWHPSAGRWIDVGEHYRETDRRSRFATPDVRKRRYVVPRRPVDHTAMEAYLAVVARLTTNDGTERR